MRPTYETSDKKVDTSKEGNRLGEEFIEELKKSKRKEQKEEK